MVDFKKYIERRQRVEAFQFVDPIQAVDIARTFRSTSINLEVTDEFDWHVDIAVQDGPTTYTQRVNRGDWITREPWSVEFPRVIPAKEFPIAWEEEK